MLQDPAILGLISVYTSITIKHVMCFSPPVSELISVCLEIPWSGTPKHPNNLDY